MVIVDILDVLDNLADEQREIVVNALLDHLTVFSHYTILEAQLNWDGNVPYTSFVRFQNEVIRECVKIEQSLFGSVLRQQHGLSALTLRTEINL